MRILQISKFSFERHRDNPRRLYIKTLSHGLLPRTRYNHRKVLWIGLWFFELRLCLLSKVN